MLSEENKFPEHCLKLEEVAGSATYKQSCQQSFFLVLFVCFVLFCLLAENNQPVKILVFWLEFPLPNDNVPLRGFNTSTTSKVTKTKNFWTTWLTLTVVFFRWSLWTCFQLHQRRYVFTCVSWLVCQHDSTKTTEWISDKLGWTMGLGPEQIPIKGLWLILRDWPLLSTFVLISDDDDDDDDDDDVTVPSECPALSLSACQCTLWTLSFRGAIQKGFVWQKTGCVCRLNSTMQSETSSCVLLLSVQSMLSCWSSSGSSETYFYELQVTFPFRMHESSQDSLTLIYTLLHMSSGQISWTLSSYRMRLVAVWCGAELAH